MIAGIGAHPMVKHADAHFQAWQEAISKGHPITAQCHASQILDIIRFLGLEPRWQPGPKREFLNWCDAHGLFKKP